jgi:hypothetical protein
VYTILTKAHCQGYTNPFLLLYLYFIDFLSKFSSQSYHLLLSFSYILASLLVAFRSDIYRLKRQHVQFSSSTYCVDCFGCHCSLCKHRTQRLDRRQQFTKNGWVSDTNIEFDSLNTYLTMYNSQATHPKLDPIIYVQPASTNKPAGSWDICGPLGCSTALHVCGTYGCVETKYIMPPWATNHS